MVTQTERLNVTPEKLQRIIQALKIRIHELSADRDYWKRQAKEFAVQLDKRDSEAARDKVERETEKT